MIVTPEKFSLPNLPAFIVVDGVNGAGKSTLQAKIKALFELHNKPLHLTREPGATVVGGQIRRIVLGETGQPGGPSEQPSSTCEMMLFGADRAEHVAKVINPKLAAGCSVLSDRYYYSTIAFQGYGRGLDLSLINRVNEIAIQGRLPELFILLDLDPREGIKRKQATQSEHDRFEHEQNDFQERMRRGFLATASAVTEPCLIVDASMGPEQVYDTVKRVLEPALMR